MFTIPIEYDSINSIYFKPCFFQIFVTIIEAEKIKTILHIQYLLRTIRIDITVQYYRTNKFFSCSQTSFNFKYTTFNSFFFYHLIFVCKRGRGHGISAFIWSDGSFKNSDVHETLMDFQFCFQGIWCFHDTLTMATSTKHIDYIATKKNLVYFQYLI